MRFSRFTKTTILLLLLTITAKAQTIHYVKQDGSGDGSSWANASNDLQAMINVADSNDNIWVAAGTYKPNRRADSLTTITPNNRYNAFVLKANVKIYGGFPAIGTPVFTDRNPATDTTILSGDIGTINTSTDNCIHVVIAAANVGAALLDGFTISRGYAYGTIVITVNGYSIDPRTGGGVANYASSLAISNCNFLNDSANYYGGGFYCYAYYDTPPSLPTINNCSFINNTSNYGGGGIYTTRYSSPITTNCNFRGNTATNGSGGALYSNFSSKVISCSFSNNTAQYEGGALRNDGDTNIVKNCIFSGNTAMLGGGIYDTTYRYSQVMNCIFINNTVQNGGAGIYNTAPMKLINSLFINNKVSGGNGAAVFNLSAAICTITNCTFYGNTANNCGGVYNTYYNCCTPTPTSISNCILWANSSPQIQDAGTTSITRYSTVQGATVYPGLGNTNINPLFIDTTNIAGPDAIIGTPDDGLALQSTSTAINTGNDSLYEIADANKNNNSLLLDTDIANNPRVNNYTNNGIIDMGAYEAGPVYTFTGSGNWTDAVNWLGGSVPPSPLPNDSSIIVSGQAVLNTAQVIDHNARITVLAGGNLALPSNLIVE